MKADDKCAKCELYFLQCNYYRMVWLYLMLYDLVVRISVSRLKNSILSCNFSALIFSMDIKCMYSICIMYIYIIWVLCIKYIEQWRDFLHSSFCYFVLLLHFPFKLCNSSAYLEYFVDSFSPQPFLSLSCICAFDCLLLLFVVTCLLKQRDHFIVDPIRAIYI